MSGAPHAREAFSERSGVRIRFLDNAPSEPIGLPILFSPGFTDFADEYAELLEFFAPRRTLVAEVRGRGGSEAPAAGYASSDHVADLGAVLDEEGVGRFHLMTFSRGTTWGLDLALADPDRVATVSIGDYWAGEHALDESMAEQVMTNRFRGIPMGDRVAPHVIPALFEASVDRDLHDALAATGLPILVASGDQPGCILDDNSLAEYRTRIPGVEFVTIAGASHDLFRPDRLAYPRAVADFIRRRSADE